MPYNAVHSPYQPPARPLPAVTKENMYDGDRRSYAAMLERATTDGQLSATAQRYLHTITSASVEMGVLIDNLLAFARMGRVEMRTSEVALSELVTDAIRGLEMATSDRNVVWQIAPLPPAVGDPDMVRQVLANLIGRTDNGCSRSRRTSVVEISGLRIELSKRPWPMLGRRLAVSRQRFEDR